MKGHSVAAEWQYLDELCHFNVLQSVISSLWNHLQQIGNVSDLTRSGRPPQRNDHHLLVTNALRDRNQNATQLQQQHFFSCHKSSEISYNWRSFQAWDTLQNSTDNVALTRLKSVWNDRSISFSSTIRLMCSLSHPSSCMLVNHDPSHQSWKEEYRPWKWGATARYYTSYTKTM